MALFPLLLFRVWLLDRSFIVRAYTVVKFSPKKKNKKFSPDCRKRNKRKPRRTLACQYFSRTQRRNPPFSTSGATKKRGSYSHRFSFGSVMLWSELVSCDPFCEKYKWKKKDLEIYIHLVFDALETHFKKSDIERGKSICLEIFFSINIWGKIVKITI